MESQERKKEDVNINTLNGAIDSNDSVKVTPMGVEEKTVAIGITQNSVKMV